MDKGEYPRLEFGTQELVGMGFGSDAIERGAMNNNGPGASNGGIEGSAGQLDTSRNNGAFLGLEGQFDASSWATFDENEYFELMESLQKPDSI
jgi:hypothetical protein